MSFERIDTGSLMSCWSSAQVGPLAEWPTRQRVVDGRRTSAPELPVVKKPKSNRRRPDKTVFLGNPWGLNRMEAEAIWMLQAHEQKTIARRIGMTLSGAQQMMYRGYEKMHAPHGVAACVAFDRWWQSAKGAFDADTVRRFEVDLLAGARND
jgi:hypothetical protein